MRRLFVILILCACPTLSVYAQKPKWVSNTPIPTNTTYEFIVRNGESYDACFNSLLKSEQLRNTLNVSMTTDISRQFEQYAKNGRITDKINLSVIDNSTIGSEPFNITARDIDQWSDDKGSYYVLYMVGKSPYSKLDNVTVSSKYGFDGVWRSMLIPGFGQFYKGQNVKGSLIMVGFASCLSVCIYSETSRQKAINFARNTNDYEQILHYASIESKMQTVRNVTIGLCTAIYLYNIIDSAVSDGAKRLVFNGQSLRYNF